MNFKWMSRRNDDNCIVSIYENNITLNMNASSNFRNAFRVMIGIDGEGEKIAIKPVNKEDIENQGVKEDLLFKISIGSSYSRISNKKIIQEIAKLFDLDFEQVNCYKFSGKWSESESYLEVSIKGGGIS